MAEAGVGFVDIIPRTEKFASTLQTQISSTLAKASAGASGGFSKLALASKAAQVAVVGLGIGAVGAITKGISATTDWAAQIRNLQRVTGQTAEDASGLVFAGEKLGVSAVKMSTGFGILSKNIVTNNAALADYGINLKDAQGDTLPFNEILAQVSDRFNELPKGPEQAAFAMRLFGRSGRDLIPILSQGSEGLAAFNDEAERSGLIMSDEDVQAAKELTIAQRELGGAFKGLSITIGKDFVPIATKVVETITSAVQLFQKIPDPIRKTALEVTVGAAALLGLSKAFDLAGAAGTRLFGTLTATSAAQVTEAGTATAAAEAMTAEAAATTADAEAHTLYIANAAGTVTGEVAVAGAATTTATAMEASTAATVGATGALARFAPAAALAFAGMKGFQEFQQFKSGDIVGAFNTAAGAARDFGFNLQNIDASDVPAFKAGLEDLELKLKTHVLTTDDASAAIQELADKYHIGIPDINSFTQAIIKESGVTEDATGDAGGFATALQGVGKTARGIGKDFEHQAHDIIHAMKQERSALRDTFQVGSEVFSDLANKGKVSADKIINAFNRQIKAQRNYEDNLKAVQQRNIPEGILKQIQDLGLGGAGILDALAHANDEKFDQIVHKWRTTQHQGGDIANTFTGLSDSLNAIPNEVPINFRVTVNGTPVSVGAGQSLPGAVIPRGIGGGPLAAAGAIITGQTGFVTRGPTVLVGEGSSQTFAGKGAEAVIPLNDRGIAILSEALDKAMGRQSGGMHITIGFDESGDLHVRKVSRQVAQDEIEREHAFRQRVG